MSRRAAVITILVLAVLVAVVFAVVATSSSDTSGTGAAGATVAPPGTAASTSSARSLLVLPMGHLSDPSNTFWELFVRRAGSGSWKLATPPGVADNGGLVVGGSPAGAVAAAFLPSADLTFSVLAKSDDGAATWTPDSVPGVVADAPDAVATDGTGTVRAVLARPGASVVTERAGSSVWTRAVGLPPVHGGVPGCTVTGYTSVATAPSGTVATAPSGTVVVGAQCAASDRFGLLSSDASGGWTPSGPVVAGWVTGPTEVLRLADGPTGMTALADGTTSTGQSLAAAWGSGAPGASFTASPPLAVPAGWSVLASATGGGTGESLTVLLGAGDGGPVRLESVAGPGARWTTLATPPAGTGAVAALGSEVDAFVPDGSHLGIWALTPGSPTWQRVAGLTVPIQYGSSS